MCFYFMEKSIDFLANPISHICAREFQGGARELFLCFFAQCYYVPPNFLHKDSRAFGFGNELKCPICTHEPFLPYSVGSLRHESSISPTVHSGCAEPSPVPARGHRLEGENWTPPASCPLASSGELCRRCLEWINGKWG